VMPADQVGDTPPASTNPTRSRSAGSARSQPMCGGPSRITRRRSPPSARRGRHLVDRVKSTWPSIGFVSLRSGRASGVARPADSRYPEHPRRRRNVAVLAAPCHTRAGITIRLLIGITDLEPNRRRRAQPIRMGRRERRLVAPSSMSTQAGCTTTYVLPRHSPSVYKPLRSGCGTAQ
jgi:hypothetical protein